MDNMQRTEIEQQQHIEALVLEAESFKDLQLTFLHDVGKQGKLEHSCCCCSMQRLLHSCCTSAFMLPPATNTSGMLPDCSMSDLLPLAHEDRTCIAHSGHAKQYKPTSECYGPLPATACCRHIPLGAQSSPGETQTLHTAPPIHAVSASSLATWPLPLPLSHSCYVWLLPSVQGALTSGTLPPMLAAALLQPTAHDPKVGREVQLLCCEAPA